MTAQPFERYSLIDRHSYDEREKRRTTLLLNEIFKKEVLIAVESDVVSIYILGRGKSTAIKTSFLKTSLIIQTLPASVTD